MAPRALEAGHVKVGRLVLHHTTGGVGTPVLFVHGLGSSGYIEWRFNLQHFAHRHRVLAPDLPGFGRSDKPTRARYGIDWFSSTLDRYLDAVGAPRVAVVGTSMGGRVALELALQKPRRVERLVLVNSLGLGRPQVQFFYPLMVLPRVGEAAMRVARVAVERAPAAMVRRFAARYAAASEVERTMDDSYLADLREMYGAAGYSDAYLATVRSMARPSSALGIFDATGRLGELKMPVQLVWGANDPLFPVAHATRAHGLLPGSRLAIIQGAGHTPQAERPDEFNRILDRFIAGA